MYLTDLIISTFLFFAVIYSLITLVKVNKQRKQIDRMIRHMERYDINNNEEEL